jgi:hypothetical protein
VPSPSRRSWMNSNPSWKADMPFGFRKTFPLSKLLSLNMFKQGSSLAGRYQPTRVRGNWRQK